MKINETMICPDLECNEVYSNTENGCPRCLSSEGIPLIKILLTIEELSKTSSGKTSQT